VVVGTRAVVTYDRYLHDREKLGEVRVNKYSLHFKIKVIFGHELRYEIEVTFCEISLKLRQMNWNVAKNNANVVIDELPSQIIVYTCLTIDI
jgi:hypothetical protein